MARREVLEVSHAVSEAVKLAKVDVIAAYPITPQTHIVERLSEMVANGELDAEYVNVESEHSALSMCVGTSATGARVFTATCSQGLALMHEILFVASALRLPIVMSVVNRALSAPINIWGDHSDIMAERDCGWIQLFVENGQEALDFTLQSFKIGENSRVLLPVVVNLDAFSLSHVIEPVNVPEDAEVRNFLPDRIAEHWLNPDDPKSFGSLGDPDFYMEAKKLQDHVLRSSREVIDEVWKEFGNLFQRHYQPIELYRIEGAETVLLTLGGISGTAKTAVDKMRKEGKKVGLIKLRLFRPFPFKEIRDVAEEIEALAVVERALCFGGPGGPVASEIRSALYPYARRPIVAGFIAGLGGRDVTVSDFETIANRMEGIKEKGQTEEFEMIGVRE